ncbi:MAG: twin-arginine translocase TatA/TatE family subunit [Blastocatellia bacterium]
MGLGMPEVVLILVIALIVFGPRKLPELGKSLGQAMAQFRRASDDFKRTWEQEVELDSSRNYGQPASDSYQPADANDPYNPYAPETSPGETSTPQLPASTTDTSIEPQPAPDAKKHWI